MADLSKTVEIIFGGKNEVSKVIDDIGKNFNELDDVVGKIASPLAGVAESILKVDAALAAMAIGGLAYAVKTAGDFNGKFGEITTLISDTGQPIEKFKSDIKNYAVDSVKSIDDINQALYTSISAGVDYKDSIKFVNEAEKLSVAGRSELGDTTKVLISTLNAYGASTDQADKYSDTMFTTVKLGLTTMSELSERLAMVTGLAANAGIPFETLSAAIAALTVSGLPTAEAITGIKAAIQNIIKPAAEAEKMAASLGLQFNASALQTKGFEGVLWDAWKATGGNTEKMAQLFGSVEALNSVLVLASDKTGKFKETLAEMGKSAGATQVAYDKVANEFANINQRLENSFKITLGEIGDKLMPKYGDVATSFGNLMKGIKVGVDSGAFDPLFAYLDTVGGSISQWLNGVALAFPDALKKLDFDGLIKAFKDLGAAVGSYFGDLDLTKADDLASAMQLVVDIVTGLVNVTSGMAEAFRPFVVQIVEFFKVMAAGGPEAQQTIGKILAFATAIEQGGLAIIAAILAIDEFGVSMKGLFNTIAGGTQVMWNGFEILLASIKAMTILVAGFFVTLLDKLSFGMFPGLDEAKAQLTEWGSTINTSFAKHGADAAEGLAQLGQGLIQLGTETSNTSAKTKELATQFKDIPKEVKTTIDLSSVHEAMAAAKQVKADIEAIPVTKEVGIKVLADGTTIEKAYGMIIQRFPDGQTLITNVGTEADAAKLDATQKKIDAAIPKDKVIEAQLKMDEARMKEQSDIIQKSVEWKAKLDIANVEAGTKQIEALFKSLDNSIDSTGTTMLGLVNALVESQKSGPGSSLIENQIRDENARREQTFLLQKELTQTEIANIKAKTEAMKRGDAMIKVDGAGLQPELEAFMYKILGAIQVRANSEGVNFLVGA